MTMTLTDTNGRSHTLEVDPATGEFTLSGILPTTLKDMRPAASGKSVHLLCVVNAGQGKGEPRTNEAEVDFGSLGAVTLSASVGIYLRPSKPTAEMEAAAKAAKRARLLKQAEALA